MHFIVNQNDTLMSTPEISEELKSCFIKLCSVALSDCRMNRKEIKILFELGEAQGISRNELAQIFSNPRRVGFVIPDSVPEKIEYLYDFAKMIWNNRKLKSLELDILKKLCIEFQFEAETADEIVHFLIERAKRGTSKSEIFTIIGCNQN